MKRHAQPGRMRVGMHTTVGPRCGIADYTRALSAALAPHAEITTVPIHPARLNPLAVLAAGVRLGRHDVAHIQHTYSFFGVDQLTYTLLVRLLLASIRAPLVLTAHTIREPGPTRYDGGLGSWLANLAEAPRWLDVETFRSARAVIVHAEVHRDALATRGVPTGQIRVIPPGVPAAVPISQEVVERFRRRHGLEDRTVVGVFGFVESSKRYGDVLAALKELPPEVALLVAGGPRLPTHQAILDGLWAEARRRDLAHRVRVTGYLSPDEVPAALATMDVVVVPYATPNSVSYSLHVALGQHRPVLAADLPALREISTRAGCLALFPADDATGLAKELARLLGDADARHLLMERARAFGQAQSVAWAAGQTLALYREVAGWEG